MAVTSELRVYRRIVPVTIIMTLCFGLIFSGAGGGIFNKNDQIRFIAASSINTPGDVTFLDLPTITNQINDTIIVTTGGDTGNITTVTDTFGDVYARKIQLFIAPNPFGTSFEVWTTKTSLGGFNTIHLTTDNLIIVAAEVGIYQNVGAIGNFTGTTGNGSPSLTMLTAKSGSWITGQILSNGATCPATVSASAQFIDRGQICTTNLGVLDLQDNATVVRNNLLMTFAPGSPGTAFAVSMIELVAVDQAPQNPAFNNFCTSTNGLCVTSQYSLNYAKVSTIPNSGTVALASGTAYCTGITTVGLTSKAGKPIQVEANYGGFNRNVTAIIGGPDIFMQIYVTTTAPSTTFAAGLCSASGNTEVATGMCTFSTSGGITASNACSIGMNGAQSGSTIGTVYYGFIEVTPLNLGPGVGHLQYNQVPLNANAICSLSMFEAV